jgi:hypothetical protein
MKTLNNILISVVTLIFLSSCGTYTPIPSHGGGKRFAIEQLLVSAVSRKAISDIPFELIKNKKIMYDLSMVQDEGGGAINGGRTYASEILDINNNSQKTSGSDLQTRQIGLTAQRNDNNYAKDYTFNGSDSKQFNNLLVSSLIRRNIMLSPKENEGKAEYYLEIIVDVLGTWRSRSDWLFTNNESLKAVISLEYVITPYSVKSTEARKVGRISYEAEYNEKYAAWMGPVSTNIVVKKSDLGNYISDFGSGSSEYNNIVRNQPTEFDKKNTVTPVQINPQLK